MCKLFRERERRERVGGGVGGAVAKVAFMVGEKNPDRAGVRIFTWGARVLR